MDSSYKLPGGGFLSTAADMARFAISVLNGTIIKPETFAEMSKNQKTKDGRETRYGYGWYVAVIVLTNVEAGGMLDRGTLAKQLGDIVLQ